MSERLELERARHAYNRFIEEHRACHAKTVVLGETDQPVVPQIDVPKTDVVDRFLRSHPEYEGFREHFMAMHPNQSHFPLAKALWKVSI